MSKRSCLLIGLPGLSLGLFIGELFRRHGYAPAGTLTMPASGMLVAGVVAAQWWAYAYFLARTAQLGRGRALRLDLAAHLPLLLPLAYWLPTVGRLHNSGTYLLAAALLGLAAIRSATLLYFRREVLESLAARPYLILAAIVSVAAALRISIIDAVPLSGDESLYCSWGLLIATGRDLFLRSVLVDKPPLFLYTLAGFFRLLGSSETVARLPNLICSLANIALLYELARRLYGRRTALVAALLLALSPMDIQYAPTAYTDTFTITFALGACLAAVAGHYAGAGLLLGLSVAAKQTALLYLPLILLLAALPEGKPERKRRPAAAALRLGSGLAAVMLSLTLWDVVGRAGSPGFMDAANAHYGGLGLAARADLLPRLRTWLSLARYVTAGPLSVLLLAGTPVLLAYGFRQRHRQPSWRLDWVPAGFAVYYLLLHTALNLGLWDRYLLGLVPFLALLLARIILLPGEALPMASEGALGRRVVYPLVAGALLCVALAHPVRIAVAYGFPIGSDGGRFQGIDDAAEYLRGQVPPHSVVFHKLLGWHYAFYLFDAPLDLYYYTTPAYLLDLAQRLPPGKEKYIVIPHWSPAAAELRATLEPAGWTLTAVYQALNRDGSVSLTVYRVEPS